MGEEDRLLINDVAALAGIQPASLRRAKSRGTVPVPDGVLLGRPWWYRSTVEDWLANRKPHPKHRPSPALSPATETVQLSEEDWHAIFG